MVVPSRPGDIRTHLDDPSGRGAMAVQRGRLRVDRCVRTEDGRVVLEQRFSGSDTRVLVTHRASMIARVEVRSGSLSIAGVTTPRAFTLWVAPRSCLRMTFSQAIVVSRGTGSLTTLSRRPSALLNGDIDSCEIAPLTGQGDDQLEDARLALHEVITARAPVRQVARTLGMHPDALTHAFSRCYGISPKAYCQRARLFDAAIALFHGARVIDAAFGSGFNDLGRFYAQFRSRLGMTPASYGRAGRAETAKTLVP